MCVREDEGAQRLKQESSEMRKKTAEDCMRLSPGGDEDPSQPSTGRERPEHSNSNQPPPNTSLPWGGEKGLSSSLPSNHRQTLHPPALKAKANSVPQKRMLRFIRSRGWHWGWKQTGVPELLFTGCQGTYTDPAVASELRSSLAPRRQQEGEGRRGLSRVALTALHKSGTHTHTEH